MLVVYGPSPQLALQKMPWVCWQLAKCPWPGVPPFPLSSLHLVPLQLSLGLNFHLSRDSLRGCNLVSGPLVGRLLAWGAPALQQQHCLSCIRVSHTGVRIHTLSPEQAPLLCFGVRSLPDLPISEAGLGVGFHACGCFGVIILWMSRAALHP